MPLVPRVMIVTTTVVAAAVTSAVVIMASTVGARRSEGRLRRQSQDHRRDIGGPPDECPPGHFVLVHGSPLHCWLLLPTYIQYEIQLHELAHYGLDIAPNGIL